MTLSALCLLALVALSGASKPQKCFSKGLGRFFKDGDKWTEPPCQQAQCDKGRVIRLPCGLLAPPRPGCKVVGGKVGAPYPTCCPRIVCRCFSKSLGRFFKEGDKWTEPPCSRAECGKNGAVSALGCPLIKPGPGCVSVEGKPGAPYPKCCNSFICPKPGQCYSKSLRKFFNDGDKWTEPSCQRAACDKGKVIRLPCGLLPPLRPGCKVVGGKVGAPYPTCCPSIVCRCFSKALGRFFKEGDKWTEPPCSRAECGKDGAVSAVGCPVFKAGPGCVPVKGKPGAPYPKCCNSFICPKPGQCYSKSLRKFFNDGEKWTEPGCLQASCSKGEIARLPCPSIALPRPGSGCKLVKGKPGAPYPRCCVSVVCPKPRRCFSKVLRRYFAHGRTWREPYCVRATCKNGRIIRRTACKGFGKYGCKGKKAKCAYVPKIAGPKNIK